MDVIEYPKMLYQTEHIFMIVDNDAHEKKARDLGFVDFSALSDVGESPKPRKRKNTVEAIDHGDSDV